MRKLIIDIGNTRSKAAVFEGDHLKEYVTIVGSSAERLSGLSELYGPIKSTMISSVTSELPDLDPNLFGKVVSIRVGLRLPIRITYKTPESLGNDRLANAVGAWFLNPERNTLVVDAGTCIKYDLVTADGAYPGGAISPGLNMRYKAMHKYTGKLPHLKHIATVPELTGNTTEFAMRSGVIHGAIHEVKGMIEAFRKQTGQLDVLLTGGDAGLFEGTLKNAIFAAPHLTLTGLKVILDHND